MAGSFNCWINPNSAADQVGHQMDLLRGYADIAFDRAIQVSDQLVNYNVAHNNVLLAPIQFADFPISDPTGYLPALDESNFVVPQMPPDPVITLPDDIGDPGPAPTAPAEAPNPVFGLPPSVYTPTFGAAPDIVYPDVPQYGDITGDIPLPDLFDIVLPDAPDVDIDGIVFAGVRPTFTANTPDADDFDYTEVPYDPLMVDQLTAKLTDMLNGQSGIPLIIENALWEREAEREFGEALRAEQDVVADWGSRGFSRPGGQVAALLERARQNNQNQRNQKSRDVAIRVQEVLIQQLDKAVTSGIALEDVWVRLYSSVQDRRLQAAQVAVNISIAVFNAHVSLFNAEMQGYQIDAQVYKERIEAEIAKVQLFAEQIRAQSLVSQINQQAVELYRAQLSAVEVNVRAYLGFVQAYTAQLDGERLKLDVYRTTLEAENTKLQSSSLQVQIFGQLVQAESVKQQAYVGRTQSYVASISAWQTQYQALIERFRAELGLAETQTKVYDAKVRGLEATLGIINSQINEITQRNTARIQGFSAMAQAAGITNDAQARRALARTETNKANAELSINVGGINVSNAQRASTITLEALQAASRVLAQLASGSLAAGSVSAAIQDSTSASAGCSYNTQQIVQSS